LTRRASCRHIRRVPRERVPDDERAFRAFLSARGFDDDVMAVAFHLYRATQEAIARAEAEVLRPLGLSWVGYVTLMGLWVLGPSEVRVLARMQVASKPAVVKSLDVMERLRLVRRRRSDADRRLVRVELTPAGRTLVRRVQRDVHRREHRLTARLTAVEKRSLARLLRKLDTSRTDGR
jgi:DNA-binding MarR family transcriptional regulator